MYIIIVGAGKVGYNLAKLLLSEKHEVMLIEKDRTKMTNLYQELGESVIYGDGTSMHILKEAGANRADIVVAATGEDETNLVICQMTKIMFLSPRTIARINNPKNEAIFSSLGIDSTVNATKMIDSMIGEQVKAEDMVIPLLSLKGGKLEIVQIELSDSTPIVNKKVKDITLPPDCILISINRGNEVIIPKGDTELKADDQVVALVRKESVQVLRDMI